MTNTDEKHCEMPMSTTAEDDCRCQSLTRIFTFFGARVAEPLSQAGSLGSHQSRTSVALDDHFLLKLGLQTTQRPPMGGPSGAACPPQFSSVHAG